MRATRLVSLLLLLQLRGQLTAAELAGALRGLDPDDSPRRRVARSRRCSGRGAAGARRRLSAVRWLPDEAHGLTAAEAEALFVAPAPAAELGLGGVLTNARLKVLSALPPDLQERASRAERYFHLDTRGWFRAEDTVPHLRRSQPRPGRAGD
jgi:hypothetical protein